MKYLGNKISFTNLAGRLLYTTKFIDKNDIVGKKILDVGCGFGWFAQFCLSNKAKNFTGIDIEDTNLEMIKKDFATYPNASFKKVSILEIDYKNDLDTITMWEVIEHLPINTEKKMFEKVYASLKLDGVFYLSTPYHSFFSILLDPAYWLIGHRHYKALNLIQIALNSGLYLEKVEVRGKLWEIFSALNMYIAKWIFRHPPFFENFFDIKRTKEFSDNTGFANIFLKFRKVK